MLGDEVRFVKGVDPNIDAAVWDRIYITTLFTFDFAISVETILHYMRLVNDVSALYVGGIMASLMPDNIVEATGIDRAHILTGLFTNTSVVGDNNDINVDQLPLDYDILEDVDYKYPAGDNYFAYTTRGCPNHCSFCAVPILEPAFHVTNNIVEQIKTIDQKYGPKQHLLLLDNNVLNAPNLESLVDDLCAAGFERGAKYVDPGTYNIVMMRYHNGDSAKFLDKKMMAYLDKFKKRIKSPENLDTFLRIVIGAEDAEDYAGYMLEHEDELSPIVEKYRSKAPNTMSDDESGRQVQRYIRLTYLILELLQLVDDGKIALTPAVELSYLPEKAQTYLLEEMRRNDCTPSLSQAVRLKKEYQAKTLTVPKLRSIMGEEKVNQKDRLKIPMERIRKFFPKSYTPIQIEEAVVKLCEKDYLRRTERER